MAKNLEAFLSEHISLTAAEMEAITALDLITEVKKGTVLLREGQMASKCYLVLQGCIRSYSIVEGEEKTTDFFTEGQPIVPVSYIQKKPSTYFLATVENCIVSSGNEHSNEIVKEKIPRMGELIRQFNEKLLAESQVKFENYFLLSPQQRYVKLLETRPELCQRVPQYLLASYLGIKPQSLSRIRRKMVQNKQQSS